MPEYFSDVNIRIRTRLLQTASTTRSLVVIKRSLQFGNIACLEGIATATEASGRRHTAGQFRA